jgi:predicted RNA-binding protein (virulence factor B family)
MALIGKRNLLTIVREAPPGLYLDGGPLGEILLPKKYITDTAVPGSKLDVFVYRDSEDRLVATTETPHAVVGEFAFLKVVSWDQGLGAFLDWGLSKDLLLPRREQTAPLRPGDWIVVHVSLDEKSDRIVASARLNRALSRTPPDYSPYQPVKLLIAEETPLGYNAIIENAHRGLLYRENLTRPLKIGERLDGYVRSVRPDGKLDLSLDPVGIQRIASLTDQILEGLRANGGRLPYHDKTSPDDIREAFGTSKKAFKQAVGTLYRKRLIQIEPTGIRLTPVGKK